MESYLHTSIAETTNNIDIDVRFFNSHIFTTTDISNFNKSTEPKVGVKYLCISTEILFNDCVVIADINIKPRLLLVISILSYLTKEFFNPSDFTITATTSKKNQEVENEKVTFNTINLLDEFKKIIVLLDSNKNIKKQLFYKKLERYFKILYSDEEIKSWGVMDKMF